MVRGCLLLSLNSKTDFTGLRYSTRKRARLEELFLFGQRTTNAYASRHFSMRAYLKGRIPAAQNSKGKHLHFRCALFVPIVSSSNGALGSRADAPLKQVFGFVKKEGRLGMRSSQPWWASTLPTTWFSAFWRQRISTAAAATRAAFDSRVLRAD